jgi:hypothetical protein
MTRYRPGGIAVFVGTITILVGGAILVSGVASRTPIQSYFFGALLVFSGLLLRIEGAILRAGGVSDPPDDQPVHRPWHRDREG